MSKENRSVDGSVVSSQLDKIKEHWTEYSDYFGGAYIGDDLRLYVLVTCDPRLYENDILNATGNKGIILEKVKNSYKKLEEVKDALRIAIDESIASGSKTINTYIGYGIDEKANKVVLEVFEEEIEKAFSIEGSLAEGDKDIIKTVHDRIFQELSKSSPLINEEFVDIIFKSEEYKPMAQ
jgi:hypothetical protein